MGTWKGMVFWTSHGGVMGLHIRCRKMHQNAAKWTKMVTVLWESKVFQICPEWLMWSISGVNGHLKGDRSQSKSWRSHGVAHGVDQNASKCTKIHKNALKCMTEQSVSNLVEWLKWSVFLFNGLKKGDRRQSMGLRMRCIKMHQNAPNWSPYHDRANSFEFVLKD